MCAIFSTYVSRIYAASDVKVGDTVSYTHSKRTFFVDDYVGKCCDAKVPAATSGTGTIHSVISNDTQIAKIAYYLTYQEDWLTSTGVPRELGFGSMEKSEVFARFVQIYDMGKSEFRSALSSYQSSSGITTIINAYDLMVERTQNISVPSSFKMYKVKSPGGVQDFYIWKYSPTGKFKLKKTSAHTLITG